MRTQGGGDALTTSSREWKWLSFTVWIAQLSIANLPSSSWGVGEKRAEAAS